MKTIEELIMESGWIQGSTNNKFVRFLTPGLDEHVRRYSHKNGWKNGESMLLEFVINIGKADKLNLVFKPVISPGGAEDEPYRNGLIEAMSNIEGASAPKGAHWVVHFSIKHGVANISEQSAEERKRKLRNFGPRLRLSPKRSRQGSALFVWAGVISFGLASACAQKKAPTCVRGLLGGWLMDSNPRPSTHKPML